MSYTWPNAGTTAGRAPQGKARGRTVGGAPARMAASTLAVGALAATGILTVTPASAAAATERTMVTGRCEDGRGSYVLRVDRAARTTVVVQLRNLRSARFGGEHVLSTSEGRRGVSQQALLSGRVPADGRLTLRAQSPYTAHGTYWFTVASKVFTCGVRVRW